MHVSYSEIVCFVSAGVALLRVGGRLVYSTCSLNPIEDEAVVGEVSFSTVRRLNFYQKQ